MQRKKANFVLWKKGSWNGIHKYDKKVIILLKEKMYFGNRQLEQKLKNDEIKC